jgi:hypothetical protein
VTEGHGRRRWAWTGPDRLHRTGDKEGVVHRGRPPRSGALRHLDLILGFGQDLDRVSLGAVLVLVLATPPSPCLPIWFVVDRWRGGLLVLRIMVVVLGFLSRQVKIGRKLLPTRLARLSCSERPCRRNSLCNQCLKIAGLDVCGRVHPCFF